jgi:hypothetical protein
MSNTMQASENELMHIRDKESAMGDAILADMQRITRLAAEPRVSDDSAKAAINRAARRLGISFRRARSFWYASPDAAVRAAEADRLRAEEVRILASRRIRLEQELDWIEARIVARESRGNGTSLGGVAQGQVATLLPVARACVGEPRQAHGAEEPIIDLRQMALPLRPRTGR